MSEREILFRGKRVDNGEWIEGYFLPGNERQPLHPCIFVYLPETQSFECFDIDIDTLGEYTDLKDKNGTRIFEGDIVKVADEYIDYVIRANGCFCMARQIMFYEFTYQDPNRVEVIGNIHDNPELLKGEQT